MKSKEFISLVETAMQVAINEDRMKGKKVIVFGMRGRVIKKVDSDGDTENDEIYQVKFEDGTVKNVPARDMEMQSDKREPSENELEDIANESVELDEDYKEMMKWYETSNEKKVYAILKKNNIKLPAEGFTLVQNMLKKHRDNVKKAADEIMNKHYPHLKESVDELDEALDMKKLLNIFNKLKKNDKIKIRFDSSIRKGKDFQTFVVTSPKRTVGKKGVERVIMKHVDNPRGVKYTLYNRDGSVSLAAGDMAVSMTDIKESVELDEAKNRGSEAFWKEIHIELKKVMDNKYYREFRSSNGGQALDNVISHFGKQRGWRVDRVVKEIIDKYGRNRDEYIKLSFAMAARSRIREDVELDEGKSVPAAYRKALQAYKNSDTKKVFDILKKKGFRGGPQGDVFVRNILKKYKGDVNKAAKHIEKKYPNLFKESVELDEASFKEILSKGKKLGDWLGKSYFEYKGNVWMLKSGRVVNQGPVAQVKKNFNKELLGKLKFESVEVEEDKKVTCPKCDGEGCEHCDYKGYHIESVELDEIRRTIPSDMPDRSGTLVNKILKIPTKEQQAAHEKKIKDAAKIAAENEKNKKKWGGLKPTWSRDLKDSVELDEAKHEIQDLIAKYKKAGRTAHHYPRKKEISLDGRTMSNSDAIKKMKKLVGDMPLRKEPGELDEVRSNVYVVTDKNGKVVADNLQKAAASEFVSNQSAQRRGTNPPYTIVLDPTAKAGQVLKKFARKESVEHLGEAWDEKSVQRTANTGYGINMKGGKFTGKKPPKTPYEYMKITSSRGNNFNVQLGLGKNKKVITGTAKNMANEINKIFGFDESVELDENGVEITHKGLCKEAHPDISHKDWEKIQKESVEKLDEADRPMQFPGKIVGGKMKGKFTSAQLKQLKDAYGKIGRVDPSSKSYEKLTSYLDGMNKAQLTQLVNAKIQFISSLARNRLARLKMKSESVGSEEVVSGSLKEKKKSIRNILTAAELIRKFDMKGEGIDTPAIDSKKWGTPGFTTEENESAKEKRIFTRGDFVKGRRGYHKDQEYVVHTDHSSESHMTVRVPRKDGKDRLVRVSRSNFNKVSNGFKRRRFPGPSPKSPS